MYPLVLHPSLTTEKWATHPLDRQILMIANEMSRLRNGIRMGQPQATLKETMERLFELVDLTVEIGGRSLRRELLRWRELVAELYMRDEKELAASEREVEELTKVLLLMTSGSSRILEPTP